MDFGACIRCKNWEGSSRDTISYCPILKEKTESDESCNDFDFEENWMDRAINSKEIKPNEEINHTLKMFLNKAIQTKIKKMVDYAEKSNKLQQEVINWFKSQGYDITEGVLEGYILDGIIDTTQRAYDSDSLIKSIEDTMSDYIKD